MAKKINCKDGLTSKEEIMARRISSGLKEGDSKILEEFTEYLGGINDMVMYNKEYLNMYMLATAPAIWYSAVKRTPNACEIVRKLYLGIKN